jgi:hypothetical protein
MTRDSHWNRLALENGERTNLELATLERIACALECKIDSLLVRPGQYERDARKMAKELQGFLQSMADVPDDSGE